MTRFVMWISAANDRGGPICSQCAPRMGKIYDTQTAEFDEPPLHIGCRCVLISVGDTMQDVNDMIRGELTRKRP